MCIGLSHVDLESLLLLPSAERSGDDAIVAPVISGCNGGALLADAGATLGWNCNEKFQWVREFEIYSSDAYV